MVLEMMMSVAGLEMAGEEMLRGRGETRRQRNPPDSGADVMRTTRCLATAYGGSICAIASFLQRLSRFPVHLPFARFAAHCWGFPGSDQIRALGQAVTIRYRARQARPHPHTPPAVCQKKIPHHTQHARLNRPFTITTIRATTTATRALCT